MDAFDKQRLVALRRLCRRWDEDATMELPAKQFDAYLRDCERAQWRVTLAERRAIKAQGVPARLDGAARNYWDRLTHLYGQSGRLRSDRDERTFWNAVQDLWGEFEALPPEHAHHFRSADNTIWHDLPLTMQYDFQVVRDGSYYEPWWDHPVAWTQHEMAQQIVYRFELPAEQRASVSTSVSIAMRDLMKRLRR